MWASSSSDTCDNQVVLGHSSESWLVVDLKVKGLTDRGAKNMMFDLDGKQTSVADYFEQRYHMRLRLPGAP